MIEDEDEEMSDGGMKIVMKQPNTEVYLDQSTGKIISKQEFMGKNYLMEDSIKVAPWKFGDEVKTIQGYECKQAYYTDEAKLMINGTETIEKREITAWYTDAIRAFLGPEKFNTLPGTVLAVDINNGDRVVVARVIDLRELKKNELKMPTSGTKTTQEEYRKMVAEQMKQMGGGKRDHYPELKSHGLSNMKKFVFLSSIVFISCLSFGQKFSITGLIADTLSSPLPSSTIMLLNSKDSTLVNFGVSDAKGNFEIKNVNKADYLLKVTFVGYMPHTQRVTTPTSGSVFELGLIKMQPLTKELESVIVMGEKAPVTVKRDTIEFNAGSFKTNANATVEDLLKKLPGVEVETDGTVRAQGEEVQRVTVDGREFFGRDPKLATRNLPADAIDKVQVFNKKSDQAVFTGIDDGQSEKTINLELKEEKEMALSAQ
ncbi:MAG: GLPGLI family protein [Cytophagales bacterium]|nr:GLPGLI family protein [Cytophagales bacterium]